MKSIQSAVVAVGLAGALGAGAASAHEDVQWSVTIGSHAPAPVYAPRPVQPVYTPHPAPVVVYQQPVYRAPAYPAHRYQRPTRWDRDGDGIPNRHDRFYNPPWDRDGDGIPNRHDRRYNPAWDRDGDGIANRHDRHPHGHRR